MTALGAAAFCTGEFIPVGFKGSLEMTVTAGVASAETVSQLAATKERRTSVTLTPHAGNASPLTSLDTCPAGSAASQVKYESTTSAAKTTLTLRLPYGDGKDTADYAYETE